MSGKVAPLPREFLPLKPTAAAGVKSSRCCRVFRAVNDVYEFDGWARCMAALIWFAAAILTVTYHYPNESGTFHGTVKSLMTVYSPSAGANDADVRQVKTFSGGISHALGFLQAYSDKAEAAGEPDGSLPITEYDKILFARLEVDLRSNCIREYEQKSFQCYHSGVHPTTGARLDADTLTQLAGPDGFRQIELFSRGMSRADFRARMDQVTANDLVFLSAYGFRAVVQIGVLNGLAPHTRTTYLFTIARKTSDAIGSQALREIVIRIDNVDCRNMPIYTVMDDYVRAACEVMSLLFMFKAIWEELVQLNVCRAWRSLHLSEEQLHDKAMARRRFVHLFWFYFAEPWNIIDLVIFLNYIAWWAAYLVLVVRSYNMEVKSVETLSDYDAVKSYADFRLQHLVWGIFSAVLVGLRVLPTCKMHGGLRIYSATLKLAWHRFKDVLVFFGYLYFLVTTLISPMFEITGANTLFKDTGTAIFNVALMTFQYIGYAEYFANGAPTFGAYRLIYVSVFVIIVMILVVIVQNVLLALVASAYEEAREAEGYVERTYLMLSIYRLWWIGYSRWHKWVLRKSPQQLLEGLLAATATPDVWFFQHVFARWATSSLPEMRVLAQLYTDPASERLHLYSPWAWSRASPWDAAQQAPWDEQLDYPMYGWSEVPMNPPGVVPRLLRMPPLFTREASGGHAAGPAMRLPVSYNDSDDIFSMSETEVDELLECAESCWQRMSRNTMVARFAGLGWSESGQRLLRRALLEVYRRHRVSELTTTTTTTTSVTGTGGGGGGGSDAVIPADDLSPSRGSPSTRAHRKPGVAPAVKGGDGGGDGGDDDSHLDNDPGHFGVATGHPRPVTLFNRRGRLADNLDLLWGEVSQLRQQQDELKGLLEAVLQRLGGNTNTAASANTNIAASGNTGNGNGSRPRGTALLASERPPRTWAGEEEAGTL